MSKTAASMSAFAPSGKLLIDVSEPGEDVHVACPLAMIEDVASELEAKSPAV